MVYLFIVVLDYVYPRIEQEIDIQIECPKGMDWKVCCFFFCGKSIMLYVGEYSNIRYENNIILRIIK